MTPPVQAEEEYLALRGVLTNGSESVLITADRVIMTAEDDTHRLVLRGNKKGIAYNLDHEGAKKRDALVQALSILVRRTADITDLKEFGFKDTDSTSDVYKKLKQLL